MAVETTDKGEIGRLRSLAHPLRLQMLSLLTAEPMSAAEVARELGLTHANASYHLRQLLDADLIVIEGEEAIRGGVAKRYRYPVEHEEPKPSQEELAAQVEGMCHELLRRFQRRDPGPAETYTDAELWLTPEVWREAVEQLKQASLLVHEQALRPRTKGAIKTNMTLAAFRMEQ
jgi:DNA-binding transcriptional ArsR family regulator